VAENDLEARKALEGAGKNQAKRVRAGVGRPGPDGPVELGPAAEHRRMVGQLAGMQVDRNIQLLDPLPEGYEPFVIQIVAVCLAVDERTLELQVLHGALQFVGGSGGILQRHGSEACVALRPLLHLARQRVVPGRRKYRARLPARYAVDLRQAVGPRDPHRTA